MTDTVSIVVFILLIFTFGLGVIVGECLAIDKITNKRRSKATLINEERR